METSIVTFWNLLKRALIGLVLLAVGWVAYDVFVRQLIHGTRLDQAVSFIILWFILAYIFLPRIHRILTKMYIPDYFIGRVRTNDGLLGDPVNLAIIGSEQELHQAMSAAGWVMADKLTINSSIQMTLATLTGKSYPNAPVSSAFLFGEPQDFAYQQEVNGKTSVRHHVRFWRVPKGWLLPGGYKVDWLAAGTFDRSIGFSYFTFQLTHKIASDTDVERDYILKTLSQHSSPKKILVIKNYFTAYRHRGGGGDSIVTDGALPIVEL